MFDSENISLVTRIEAGDGVTVTWRTNSDGENVYVAKVDQPWLTSYIQTYVGSTLTLPLSDADEARIAALEALLGQTAATEEPASTVPSASTGVTTIDLTIQNPTLVSTLGVTVKIKGIDGTVVCSIPASVNAGATSTEVLQMIYLILNRSTAAKKFANFSFDSGQVVVEWIASGNGNTIEVEITAMNPINDNAVFTVTDQ